MHTHDCVYPYIQSFTFTPPCCLRKHTLRCNKKPELPLPLSRDRRLFKSPLSDLQGRENTGQIESATAVTQDVSQSRICIHTGAWMISSSNTARLLSGCVLRQRQSLFCARSDPLPAKDDVQALVQGRKAYFLISLLHHLVSSSRVVLEREHQFNSHFPTISSANFPRAVNQERQSQKGRVAL